MSLFANQLHTVEHFVVHLSDSYADSQSTCALQRLNTVTESMCGMWQAMSV